MGKLAEQIISNFREVRYTLGAFRDLKANDLKMATRF